MIGGIIHGLHVLLFAEPAGGDRRPQPCSVVRALPVLRAAAADGVDGLGAQAVGHRSGGRAALGAARSPAAHLHRCAISEI